MWTGHLPGMHNPHYHLGYKAIVCLKTKHQLSVGVHTFHLSTGEIKASWAPWVQGQPGLPSELQVGQEYTVRPWRRKKKNQEQKQTPNQISELRRGLYQVPDSQIPKGKAYIIAGRWTLVNMPYRVPSRAATEDVAHHKTKPNNEQRTCSCALLECHDYILKAQKSTMIKKHGTLPIQFSKQAHYTLIP